MSVKRALRNPQGRRTNGAIPSAKPDKKKKIEDLIISEQDKGPFKVKAGQQIKIRFDYYPGEPVSITAPGVLRAPTSKAEVTMGGPSSLIVSTNVIPSAQPSNTPAKLIVKVGNQSHTLDFLVTK